MSKGRANLQEHLDRLEEWANTTSELQQGLVLSLLPQKS